MSNEDQNIDSDVMGEIDDFVETLPSASDEIVGTDQDGDYPDQESDLDNSAVVDEDVSNDTNLDNEQKRSKSDEQLRQERADAVKEAIFNAKKAKAAKAETDYYKTAHSVLKNPASIQDLRRSDPDLAEQVAQENWGYSAQEVVDAYIDTPQTSTIDIRAAVREELNKERSAQEHEQIDGYVQEFIIENNIDPTGYEFRKIMDTYNEFSPTNISQAKKLLDMAYGKKRHVEQPSAIPSSRGTSRPKKDPKLSQNVRDLLRQAQYTDDDFKQYEGK